MDPMTIALWKRNAPVFRFSVVMRRVNINKPTGTLWCRNPRQPFRRTRASFFWVGAELLILYTQVGVFAIASGSNNRMLFSIFLKARNAPQWVTSGLFSVATGFGSIQPAKVSCINWSHRGDVI